MDTQKLSTTAIGYIYAYEVTAYDENYLHNNSTPVHCSVSSDTLSNTSCNNQPVITSASIGSNLDIYEEQPTTQKHAQSESPVVTSTLTPSKKKSSSKLKKTKNLFSKTNNSNKASRPKIVEVSPVKGSMSNDKLSYERGSHSSDVLEVPGIVNTSFSSTAATTVSSARSSSSSECVWDTNFHGFVIAINRRTVIFKFYVKIL